ncbi:BnaC09g11620D [Brassica napus]|uniref:BnaC09g11620D protein n=1 Tax=Brassica napus TaxID=3708 RepID=A0A078GK95_BRANA|nr:BnaC09g11620D [Brassica napus]
MFTLLRSEAIRCTDTDRRFQDSFSETCARKNLTDEEKQKWSKALNDVGNIAGEDFLRWFGNEAVKVEKIARDVSDKLNATPSRNFDGMALARQPLLELYTAYSLIEQLLSNILNQDGIRICHLGMIQERLHDQKVLIVLDDVNDVKQLEALANETTWFGPGSRIVVTTENKEILQQHGINNMYHVRFPSDEEALKILLGSSLREKNEDEWKGVIHRLETILDRDIEDAIRVGYESLHEKEQSLFLHIAVFFNYKESDLVKAMFADNHFDTEQGLKILVNRSLIYMSTKGEIVMHKLLQQMGTQAVYREKPWKHRIIIDAQ